MELIDRSDKKSKWTIMKYVDNFDLIVKYASIVRRLNAKVDEDTIKKINSIMKGLHIYQPKGGKPSVDTTSFKICQIVYFMFAYKSENEKKEIVFGPLGNLLLDNQDKPEWVAKIFLTMLYNMPFNHPFNKMNPDFNIYPLRLIYKLLCDDRLGNKLYEDEVFYYVFWVKEINDSKYEELVKLILHFRSQKPIDKLNNLFTERLSVQDSLANALHETTYLFGQLESAGIAHITKGVKIGTLRQGGFGRGDVPDFLSKGELAKHKPTGTRSYKTNFISLNKSVIPLTKKLLDTYPYDDKPHDLRERLGHSDYILNLYNFYPKVLREELGISQSPLIQSIFNITNNINKYSRNMNEGDCYRFEKVLADAFNEFIDVEATQIGGAGNTDVECIYLTIREKFAIEAKSTRNKLNHIDVGRLIKHRKKINAKYTILVAPAYVPSAITDIENSDNVVITASSLSNFLYQCAVHSNENGISYEPLYNIVHSSLGYNITSKVNEYVAHTFGIGKEV